LANIVSPFPVVCLIAWNLVDTAVQQVYTVQRLVLPSSFNNDRRPDPYLATLSTEYLSNDSWLCLQIRGIWWQ